MNRVARDRVNHHLEAANRQPHAALAGPWRYPGEQLLYETPEALQADLDEWMTIYNEHRTHQGRWCFGKTPMQTFIDSVAWAHEKQNVAKTA